MTYTEETDVSTQVFMLVMLLQQVVKVVMVMFNDEKHFDIEHLQYRDWGRWEMNSEIMDDRFNP